MRKKLIVLSGAGVSAESGIPTFSGADGLWEGYEITQVATFDAWTRNPALVQEFYNQRRKGVLSAEPNEAHRSIAQLEAFVDVHVITQNIDDLHERGGSTSIMHLHGQITKSRSTVDERLVYDIEGSELKMGHTCELGSQLRPHIVWFGEAVPMIEPAAELVSQADYLLIVGTSLVVYPAAGLMHAAPAHCKLWAIDPNAHELPGMEGVRTIALGAVEGMRTFKEELLEELAT